MFVATVVINFSDASVCVGHFSLSRLLWSSQRRVYIYPWFVPEKAMDDTENVFWPSIRCFIVS